MKQAIEPLAATVPLALLKVVELNGGIHRWNEQDAIERVGSSL